MWVGGRGGGAAVCALGAAPVSWARSGANTNAGDGWEVLALVVCVLEGVGECGGDEGGLGADGLSCADNV